MTWLIILLIALGALLLVTELVLLPGVTVAAIGAVACYLGAGFVAWQYHGMGGLLIVVCIIVVLSAVAIWFSLRAKTWKKFALADSIESRSQESPAQKVSLGARGVTLGRLAPMGTVVIGGENYEAKTTGEFLDPRTEVEVVGFENFNVIVKPAD